MPVPHLPRATENVRFIEYELAMICAAITMTARDSSFVDCKQLLDKQVTGSAHLFQQR
jgi:hypothetical protein